MAADRSARRLVRAGDEPVARAVRPEADEAAGLAATLAENRGFAVDLTHLTIVGRCSACGG